MGGGFGGVYLKVDTGLCDPGRKREAATHYRIRDGQKPAHPGLGGRIQGACALLPPAPSLGAPWARLGGLFGAIWMPPARRLLASWGPLGPSWAEKGGQHGSKLASKIEQKSIKIRCKHPSKK